MRLALIICKIPFTLLMLILIFGILFRDKFEFEMAVAFYLFQVYGIFCLIRSVWCLVKFNTWDQEQHDRTAVYLRSNKPSLNHMVVIPAYKEDIEEMKATINKLAELRQAKTNVSVVLAMEKRDASAPGKAVILSNLYANTFREILHTFHESQPGEIAGKGSNVAWMFNRLVMDNKKAALAKWDFIHILDVDTHHSQDYFDRVEAIHCSTPAEDRRKLYFSCPIAFNRNYNEVAWPVRVNDTFWSLAGISSFYPDTNFAMSTSTYCLALELAINMNGWDTSEFGIGEDFHTALKAQCEADGGVITKVVYSAASQLNVTRERINMEGWIGDVMARYQQGCRHLWGVLTFSYVMENFIKKPSLLKRWRSWLMLSRCVEPIMILYVVVISWVYLGKTWSVFYLFLSTWANGLFFAVSYLYTAIYIFPKWQIKASHYEIVKSVVLLILFAPIIACGYVMVPVLNAIFHHMYDVAFKGWVTSGANKKQEAVNIQQVDQLQTQKLLSASEDSENHSSQIDL